MRADRVLLPSQRDCGTPDIHDAPSSASCHQFEVYIGLGAGVRRNLCLWQQHDRGAYDRFLRERLGSSVVSLHALGVTAATRPLKREREERRQRTQDAYDRAAATVAFREARAEAQLVAIGLVRA